ncbi:hypothetical protein GR247_31205 [Rhizobium leguminosarum]|nr:hypothetical protein [Rhizobium leguminosarum]
MRAGRLLLLSAPLARAESNKWEQAAFTYLQERVDATGKPRIAAARYMEDKCTPVAKDWAISHVGFEDYAGLPIQRCLYARSQTKTEYRKAATLIAVVWMLNPDAARVAKWIGTACKKAKASSKSDCGRKLAYYILKQNGAQFAVAGHVLETQSEAGCDDCLADALIYLPFRDGVTVKLQDELADRRQATFTDEKEALDAAEKSLVDPTTFQKVGNIGRVGNIYRLDGEPAPEWLVRNRTTYLKALNGASYELLDSAVPTALQEDAR